MEKYELMKRTKLTAKRTKQQKSNRT